MIPEFDNSGNLPIGIHEAKMEELRARYAKNSPKRESLISNLSIFIGHLKGIGCRTIYIDGSFITSKSLPRDIDLCWEIDGITLEYAREAAPFLFIQNHVKETYSIDARVVNLREGITEFLDYFQQDDRTGISIPKGIIKIQI